MPNNSSLHTALCRKIRLAIQKRLGDNVLAFQRTNGTAEIGGHAISFGIPGAADLFGFKRNPSGGLAICWEIEVKTGAGKLGPNQVRWKEACQAIGVPHYVAHASDEKSIDAAAESAAEWVNRLGQQ